MFSIKTSLKYAWEKTKENMELVFFTTLLILALGSLSSIGDWGEKGGNAGLSLFGFIVMIFMIIVRIGYTKIFLKIYDGEKPKFTEIFQEYKTFWRYLGVSILTPLAILGGLLLLIIPGIIWAVRFSFAPLVVVDAQIGPIASMKESYAITKGNFWKLLLFWLTIAVLNILGFILFGIGLLITIPVSTLAAIYIYRELSKAKAGLIQNPIPQTA